MAGGDQVIFEDIAPIAQAGLSAAGPIGAGASIGLGLGQSIYGAVKGSKATPPSLYDPRIMNQITDLGRRRENLATGASFSQNMREAMTQRGAGLQALARSGNLNQYGILDRISASNINKALADMQDKELAYTQLIGTMEGEQSKRRYSLDMQGYAEDKANSERLKQSGLKNILSGVTYGVGMVDKKKQQEIMDSVPGATSTSKTGVQNFQFDPNVAPATTWSGGGGTQAPTMATNQELIMNPEMMGSFQGIGAMPGGGGSGDLKSLAGLLAGGII